MKLLFVTSQQPGARLIRWGLDSDCSHFAVCFDEEVNGSGIVFHSILDGATLEWFGDFKKSHEIIHAIEFKTPPPLKDEEDIYQGMLSEYSGEGYDWKAFLYWSWRVILKKVFRMPYPAKNSWALSGYNLCTGLAGGIKWIRDWAAENSIDLEMIAPHELHAKLVTCGYFVDNPDWIASTKTP